MDKNIIIFEIGKKYSSNINFYHVMKKSCYILSQLLSNKKSDLVIVFGNMLEDYIDEEKNYMVLKKFFEMLIYMVQTDVLYNVTIQVDNETPIKNILRLIQFSKVLKRFTITSDHNSIKNIKFNQRYILDKKQEFLYYELKI